MKRCLGVGIGRQDRLKIYWTESPYGFDSRLRYIVMIRKRMTERTLSMKWKLMKHNKSVDKTQTVQTLQNLYAGVAERGVYNLETYLF